MNLNFHAAMQSLIAQIQQELDWDRASGPSWLTEEGERVLQAAKALTEKGEPELSQILSNEQAFAEHLGLSWLEVHSRAYEQLLAVLAATGVT